MVKMMMTMMVAIYWYALCPRDSDDDGDDAIIDGGGDMEIGQR